MNTFLVITVLWIMFSLFHSPDNDARRAFRLSSSCFSPPHLTSFPQANQCSCDFHILVQIQSNCVEFKRKHKLSKRIQETIYSGIDRFGHIHFKRKCVARCFFTAITNANFNCFRVHLSCPLQCSLSPVMVHSVYPATA